jgi:SAM-dependent methyltransferase
MEEAVYNNLLKNYQKHWWIQSRVKIFRNLIKQMNLKNPKILDYGSGVGNNLNFLIKLGKVSCYEPHEKTKKFIKKKFKKVTVLNDVTKKYDLILITDVIEHVKNDKALINKLTKNLNKGGYLFCTAPAFSFLFSKIDIRFKHYRRYKKDTAIKILNKNLKLIKFSYFNFFLFIPICFSILIIKIFNFKNIKVEKNPNNFVNLILYKIFSSESFFLNRINFPFGISTLMICKKINN